MYALANLEVPQWGTMLGTDPRTGEEVWEPVVNEDGRQNSVIYHRGDVVDQANFRQSDWDALVASGAIGEQAPADDVAAAVVAANEATPPPPDAIQISSNEGAGTTDTGSGAA